jgi:hypothetical protein
LPVIVHLQKKQKRLMLNRTQIWLIHVHCFLESLFEWNCTHLDEILCTLSVCLMSKVERNINVHFFSLNIINHLNL